MYDIIDDNGNPESGYTTAEQESSASNSITSASSGISGMAERRKQKYGQISENFGAPTDSYTVEDSYETNEFPALSPQNYQSEDLKNYSTEDNNQAVEYSANRESSFDYEAIMRKKKPKTFFTDEGLGLTDDELTRLNQLLQDDERSTDASSQNIDHSHNDNDITSTHERSNTFVFQANPGGEEEPGDDDNDLGYSDYLNRGEMIDRTDENDYSSECNFNEEEHSSRLSNPSTLTNTTPVLHVPPPPDFIPPPPNFIPPPPPQLSTEEEEEEEEYDDDTLRSSGEDEYKHLDGVENYTINFEEEAEEHLTSEAEVNDQPMTYDDQVFDYQEQPDDTDHYDYFQPDDPPPPPSEEFPWTAGDDPVEDDGDTSFPAPPPAPPPPPCDWSPPRSQPMEISALKESLSNVKLRKVSGVFNNLLFYYPPFYILIFD